MFRPFFMPFIGLVLLSKCITETLAADIPASLYVCERRVPTREHNASVTQSANTAAFDLFGPQ
jgi:hypothetical protein